jgi:phosphoglycolate phosphatase
MTVEAVLFDLDGTLVDTAPEFVAVVNQLLHENARDPLDETLIRNCVSNGSRALITLAFGYAEQHAGFDPMRLRLLEMYENGLGTHSILFPGMQELLDQLAANDIRWGIVTNKPSRYAIPLIERMGLKPSNDVIICPDHVKQSKPHPEPMYLAARKLDRLPAHTLYVGDHLRDIQAGRNAGMRTVAALYGYIEQGDDPSAWGADFSVTSAADIFPIIQSLRARH